MTIRERLAASYAVRGTRAAIVAVVLVSAVASCTVQTVRLEGAQLRLPMIGQVGPRGWKPRALAAEAKIAGFEAAAIEAGRQAREAKQSEEDALKALAKEIDDVVEEDLRGELDRARAFIARNRVRAEAGRGAACPAPAPARDQGARNDARPGRAAELDDPAKGGSASPDAGEGLVPVPARDVMICTRNTILAERWREWGLALEKRGEE